MSPHWASVSSWCKVKLGQVVHCTGRRPWFLLNSLLSRACILYNSRSCKLHFQNSPSILTTSTGTTLVPTALTSQVISLAPKWSLCLCLHRLLSSLFPEQIMSALCSRPYLAKVCTVAKDPTLSLAAPLPSPILCSWHASLPLFLQHASVSGPLHVLLLSIGSFFPDNNMACSPTAFRSVQCYIPDQPI